MDNETHLRLRLLHTRSLEHATMERHKGNDSSCILRRPQPCDEPAEIRYGRSTLADASRRSWDARHATASEKAAMLVLALR